jgi:hypothetical protein
MNSKIQEQSRLMKANYKILMEERKNPKEEARLTRSATKKNVEEVPEAKEEKKKYDIRENVFLVHPLPTKILCTK